VFHRENADMVREDLYMKRFIKKEKLIKEKKREEVIKKVRAKQKYSEARQLARNLAQKKAAIKIQVMIRRVTARGHYIHILHGLRSLQIAIRYKMKKIRNDRAKNVALRKNIKARNDNFGKERTDKVMKDSKDSSSKIDDDKPKRLKVMHRVMIKLGFLKALQPKDPLGEVLSDFLLKPSSKIQSMIRMYLTRKKYFAKRKGLGLEQPKLYRYSGDRIDNKSG
jgi:hypothetical protein